jgi:hypothetical protein
MLPLKKDSPQILMSMFAPIAKQSYLMPVKSLLPAAGSHPFGCIIPAM